MQADNNTRNKIEKCFFINSTMSINIEKASQMGGLIFQLMNNNYQVVLIIETLVCPEVVVVVPAVISPKSVT